MTKTYSRMIEIDSFRERFEYLNLVGYVGKETFGSDRYVNQTLYKCYDWKHNIRPEVIKRDKGCDLGIEGREIIGHIIVHHIDPITLEDILNRNPKVFDLDNLICTSLKTHNAIHYGDVSGLILDPIERMPGDTKLWR